MKPYPRYHFEPQEDDLGVFKAIRNVAIFYAVCAALVAGAMMMGVGA